MSKHEHPSFKHRYADVVHEWDYLPEPPFEVHWVPLEEMHRPPVGMQCRTLNQAISAFFQFGYPMRPGWAGRIVDSTGRSVLTWSVTERDRDAHGPDGLIYGVEAVFRVMVENDLPNMVDAQIWADRAATR